MPIDKFALYCPVVKACEILEPRWSLLILTEMWWGSTRFNDIRRGVPGISPTLLTRRLRELEDHGLIERIEDKQTGTVEYLRTQMAVELEPIIQALGNWAYRNTTTADALCHLGSKSLMWNMRRCVLPEELPPRRIVMSFTFTEPGKESEHYWLISKPGATVDVCFIDPKFDVDLFVVSDLHAMVSAFFGHTRLRDEIEAEKIQLIGNPVLERTVERWFMLSSYAQGPDARFRKAANLR